MKIPSLLLLVAPFIAAQPQDTVGTLPANYRPVFENNLVEVVRVHYGPHEKIPSHDHSPYPTVYVYLSDSGPVRFSHTGEAPFTIVRRPVVAGAFRVSPGRIETHEVENLGAIPSDFLRIELKQVPLGMSSLSFRCDPPRILSEAGSHWEFTAPQVTIERIVSTAQSESVAASDRRPSLLVALSQLRVESKPLSTGGLYWLEANRSASIEPARNRIGHVLRILVAPALQPQTSRKPRNGITF